MKGSENMKLDSKQKVLIAIYIEYQKDVPNMNESIQPTKLGMEREVLDIAIDKLQNEGLIDGADIRRGGIGNKIIAIFTRDIRMTGEGIEYVESKIGLSRVLTGEDKVKFVLKELASSGWEQLKDIAAKALVEISRS